ncbi:MAG: alpha/beta hydrolase [Magnetovibrio sp.]|nr:alpha/beta hydrolase [Magnetovibrio sp.]
MAGSTVYADFDQAGLDAQYNNRAHVPEHVELYAGWEKICAEVLERFDHRLDVKYGSSPREALDVVLPDGPGPHPALLYIHGGYWMSRSKSDQTFLAAPYAAAGAAFVLVEYDLMPDVRMADIVRQCRDAAAWVHANAADLNIDPDRLFVSGHSAGGHLTAMLAETDWPAHAGAPADLMKGGAALSGIYDLEPIRHTYMQETLGLSAEEVAANSPIHTDPAPKVPLIVAPGGGETDEFRRQSRDFADAWNGRGGDCVYMERPDMNHFTILDDLADGDGGLFKAIAGQMGLAG